MATEGLKNYVYIILYIHIVGLKCKPLLLLCKKSHYL